MLSASDTPNIFVDAMKFARGWACGNASVAQTPGRVVFLAGRLER
jgi:hypothetical protein